VKDFWRQENERVGGRTGFFAIGKILVAAFLEPDALARIMS
jgi:hypothetical protein